MPTGYTADVGSGKVADFADFALQCARAFGATITMRDDPMSETVPEAFEPSDYHANAIADAQADLARFRAMTEREIISTWNEAADERDRGHRQRQADRDAQKARYKAMLVRVESWGAPTPEHAEMKAFMRSQLEKSIEFDCFDIEYEPLPAAAEWYDGEVKRLQEAVAYHRRENEKELERTASRNAWIKALRESLA